MMITGPKSIVTSEDGEETEASMAPLLPPQIGPHVLAPALGCTNMVEKEVLISANMATPIQKDNFQLLLCSEGSSPLVPSGCHVKSSPQRLVMQILEYFANLYLKATLGAEFNTRHCTSFAYELRIRNLHANVDVTSCGKQEIRILLKPEILEFVCGCLGSMSPFKRAVDAGDRRGTRLRMQDDCFKFLLQHLLQSGICVDIIPLDTQQRQFLPLPGKDGALEVGEKDAQLTNHETSEVRRRDDVEANLVAVRQAIMQEANRDRSTCPRTSSIPAIGTASTCNTKSAQNEDEHASFQAQTDQQLEGKMYASPDTAGTSGLRQQWFVDIPGSVTNLGRQSNPNPVLSCGPNVSNEHSHAADVTKPMNSSPNVANEHSHAADVTKPMSSSPNVSNEHSHATDVTRPMSSSPNVANEHSHATDVTKPMSSSPNVGKKRSGKDQCAQVPYPEERIPDRASTQAFPSTPVQCTESSQPPFPSQRSCWLAPESRPPPERLLGKLAVIKESLDFALRVILFLLSECLVRPPEERQVPVQEQIRSNRDRSLHLRPRGVLVTSNDLAHGCVRSDAPQDPLRQDTLLDIAHSRNLLPPERLLWQVGCQSELCPSAWNTLSSSSTNPDWQWPLPPNGLQEVRGPLDVYERLGLRGEGSPRAACLVTSASPPSRVENLPFRAHTSSSSPASLESASDSNRNGG